MTPESVARAIAPDRLLDGLESVGRIGATDRGITRLGYTPAEREAHRWAAEAMRRAGLSVRVDSVGNTIGYRPGSEADLRPIVIGSHLDTVPHGGQFDGALGVLAGIELAHVLQTLGYETRHPLEVVVFTCEEGARFDKAMIGSQAMAGRLTDRDLHAVTDSRGTTLAEAMAALGLNADDLAQADRSHKRLAAYLELHIEQSPRLERAGCAVGIVEAIAAPTRLSVCVHGEQNHSGSTPMSERKDALAAAAEMILVIENVARYEAGPATVATVGTLELSPGSLTSIPGLVKMGIDIRDVSGTSKRAAVAEMQRVMQAIARQRNVDLDIDIMTEREPARLSPDLADSAAGICERLDVAYIRLNSGAGHDAAQMAFIAPTALLFVPSQGGVSHAPEEHTAAGDVLIGSQVLAALALTVDREM